MASRKAPRETAESMGRKQREISVSEFFLKNRHLLGFDSARKALLTTVKESVDNALDACEEAGILPEVSVDILQTGEKRFLVSVTDNGPGIVRAQIPAIFAKLLYGSKFHRLRMSRGQQGIGISAAGMYGQLTTGSATSIISKTRGRRRAHAMQVQIDTARNRPSILREEEIEWRPTFHPSGADGKPRKPVSSAQGTCVAIEMEAAYVRGRLSVDEYLKQCAVVNPHLELHYRVRLKKNGGEAEDLENGEEVRRGAALPSDEAEDGWTTFQRVSRKLPEAPREIKPHPHGVELGALMEMLKSTSARTLRAALEQDFARVSARAADEICRRAGLNPRSGPGRIARQESEALYKAIGDTKLMRPPTDCLSPIGEEQMIAGLKKEIDADFYTAVSRFPAVYRGNPFLIEAGAAVGRPGNGGPGAEDPIRLMRFANRVPLLHMAGACAITKAATAVNWKSYGFAQPRGGLPLGPAVVLVHVASVWVPFTSESKEAVAHYPEIMREITFALQECGRRLAVHVKRQQRRAERERKRKYIAAYIPHLALGLQEILGLSERQKSAVVRSLNDMLEKTQLEK